MIGANVVAYHAKRMTKNTVTLADGTVIPYTVMKPRKRKPKYNHPKPLCMGARILDEIERRGGMTAFQIRKQLYEWSYPDRKYDDCPKRGWWSDPLYGGMYSKHGAGLLKTFCKKHGKRWVRNSVPHNDRPFITLAKGKPKKNPWQAKTVWDANTNSFIIQAVFNP